MQSGPRVSVVMPVYNRAWCVAEAIASVLALPEPALELVVVDDGSTDATPAILADWAGRAGQRMRVLTHPGRLNRGIARSRNLGVAQSRGTYVAFLDSDDLCLPSRFSHALDWLDAHPVQAGCIEPYTLQSADGRQQPMRHLLDTEPADCTWLRAMLFDTRYWGMACITLRRDALARFGGFDERLPLGEEIALWLKLAAARQIGVAQRDAPVAVMRRHASNSWAGARRVTEHAVYLRIIENFSNWAARAPQLPACVMALARQRMRQSLVELLLDDALSRQARARLWAGAALRCPRVVLDRRVAGNLARMTFGLRQWR